jgi:hypothetical protein
MESPDHLPRSLHRNSRPGADGAASPVPSVDCSNMLVRTSKPNLFFSSGIYYNVRLLSLSGIGISDAHAHHEGSFEMHLGKIGVLSRNHSHRAHVSLLIDIDHGNHITQALEQR